MVRKLLYKASLIVFCHKYNGSLVFVCSLDRIQSKNKKNTGAVKLTAVLIYCKLTLSSLIPLTLFTVLSTKPSVLSIKILPCISPTALPERNVFYLSPVAWNSGSFFYKTCPYTSESSTARKQDGIVTECQVFQHTAGFVVALWQLYLNVTCREATPKAQRVVFKTNKSPRNSMNLNYS